jgi:hypothetical protein
VSCAIDEVNEAGTDQVRGRDHRGRRPEIRAEEAREQSRDRDRDIRGGDLVVERIAWGQPIARATASSRVRWTTPDTSPPTPTYPKSMTRSTISATVCASRCDGERPSAMKPAINRQKSRDAGKIRSARSDTP